MHTKAKHKPIEIQLLDKYLSFVSTRFALVNGFFAGNGLALMVNIPAIPVLLLMLPDKSTLILLLVGSFIVSFIAFLYEKYFFRIAYNETMVELSRRYRKSKLKERFRDCQF